MTDLAAERKMLQVEESQFKFAVSESFAQKMGNSVNFINNRQYNIKQWDLNGKYFSVASPQTRVDGLVPVPWNIELLGAWMYNYVAGTSGTTTLDVHRYTAPGVDAGSIFTTKPSITSAAVSDAYVGRVLFDGVPTLLGGGTGMTAPVLSSEPFNLNQGDALRLDKDAAMPNAESCGLILFYRPR